MIHQRPPHHGEVQAEAHVGQHRHPDRAQHPPPARHGERQIATEHASGHAEQPALHPRHQHEADQRGERDEPPPRPELVGVAPRQRDGGGDDGGHRQQQQLVDEGRHDRAPRDAVAARQRHLGDHRPHAARDVLAELTRRVHADRLGEPDVLAQPALHGVAAGRRCQLVVEDHHVVEQEAPADGETDPGEHGEQRRHAEARPADLGQGVGDVGPARHQGQHARCDEGHHQHRAAVRPQHLHRTSSVRGGTVKRSAPNPPRHRRRPPSTGRMPTSRCTRSSSARTRTTCSSCAAGAPARPC